MTLHDASVFDTSLVLDPYVTIREEELVFKLQVFSFESDTNFDSIHKGVHSLIFKLTIDPFRIQFATVAIVHSAWTVHFVF